MSTRLILCGLCFLLGCQSASPVKKVLLIGIDGIRSDILAETPTPHLDALAEAGCFTDDGLMPDPTVSGPGWSGMLIGARAEKHGVFNNDFSTNRYDQFPDFLTRIEQNQPELHTFAVVDWPPLGRAQDGGPLLSSALDSLVLIDGDSLGYGPADSLSVVAAAAYLATENPDAAFVYLGDPDVVSHETGLSDAYRASIQLADAQVGALIGALERRPTYAQEDWLILISTDHGRNDEGGHGGDSAEERRVFFLASGPSTQRGAPHVQPRNVDVAVTALAHLGFTLDPTWNLDGQALCLGKIGE